MSCQFRGAFRTKEKERIEKAARAVEKVLTQGTSSDPAWDFVYFQTPYNGYPYWGVRLEDGYTVRAKTATGLAASLDAYREDSIRRRSRALRQVSRSITQSWRESNA